MPDIMPDPSSNDEDIEDFSTLLKKAVDLFPESEEMQPSILPEAQEDETGWKNTPLSGVGNAPPLVIYGGKTTTTYNKTIL